MKKIQTLSVSLLLIAFLAVAVFAPPTVSKIKDRMLFGKVTTQQLTDTKASTESKLSIEEKIALIVSYKANQDNVIMVNQNQQIYDQEKDQHVADIAVAELEILKDTGIFPQIEVSEAQSIKLAIESYTNMDNPGINTEIWEVAYFYNGNMINIMLDAETHLILQFNIWSKEPLRSIPQKETLDLFADYLGIAGDVFVFDKKPSTELLISKKAEDDFQFIQVREANSYGIQIAPVID